MGHRAWLGVGLAGAALLVGAVLLLPTILVRLNPPEVREPGEWRFTHRVAPVAGMTVTQRILTADHELTIVQSDDDVAQCTVDVTRDDSTPGAAARRSRPVAQRAVRIHGWTGRYVDDRPQDPYLTWEYAPGARATVTCSRGPISPETLLDVAEAVRFRDTRVPLPFTLRAMPEGYRIYSIDSDSRADVVSLTLQPVDRASIPSVVVRYGTDEAAHRCLGEAGQVCLSTRWSAEDAPGTQGIVRRSLDQVGAQIVLAPDPADRSTWFDAVDLPR